jgi:hypothetical protein
VALVQGTCGSSPEEVRRRQWSGREGSGGLRAPVGARVMLHGGQRPAVHVHRRRQWNVFTTMSCDGRGKAGAVVLELRQAGGVAAELEASST